MHPDQATATGGAAPPVPDDTPPAGPDSPRPQDLGLTAHLVRIDADLAGIAQRMITEADRAAARERVIDRQHEEIERLRGVERAGLARPVVTDLCRLRNALLLQAATRPETMTGAQVTDLLASFADMVEEALERCGVAVLALEPGCAFVAGRHQVARSVNATDPALHGRVAEILQDGYAEVDGGRIVAPARVVVHRAVPAAPPPSDTETEIPGEETIDA